MLARSHRLAIAAFLALLAFGAVRPAAAQQPTDSAAAKAAPARVEITLPPDALDAFVGEYRTEQMGVPFSVVVTREGSQLYEQATAQQRFPIFPEAADKFFLKVVDAQITFSKDAAGKVTGMVIHQNGQDLTLPRVK